jgi:hypothetical protein
MGRSFFTLVLLAVSMILDNQVIWERYRKPVFDGVAGLQFRELALEDERGLFLHDGIWAAAGDYCIALALACPPAEAGSRLRVSAGDGSMEATVPAAPAPEIPLPHRDEDGTSKYRNRAWTSLDVGTLTLPLGRTTLILEPLSMPGGQVMDLKHGKLTRRQP